MHRFRLGSILTASALLAVVACGGGGGGGGTKGTIKIGVELPESGAEASNGIPTLNGVKFAVQQQGSINGFKLEVANKDDAPAGKHDPQVGANNVRALVADSAVLGIIGPFNSSVAKAEIPIANQADLTMISPANTAICLTKDLPEVCGLSGAFHPADIRPKGTNNYFRVAATDDHQGGALADYAYDSLNLRSVGVIDDLEVYGQGVARTFSAEFCKKGGTVVGGCPPPYPGGIQESDTSSESSFGPTLNRLKSGGANGVYFGGTDSTKGCVIRNQMKGIFTAASAPYLGGDGIVTAQCIN